MEGAEGTGQLPSAKSWPALALVHPMSSRRNRVTEEEDAAQLKLGAGQSHPLPLPSLPSPPPVQVVRRDSHHGTRRADGFGATDFSEGKASCLSLSEVKLLLESRTSTTDNA